MVHVEQASSTALVNELVARLYDVERDDAEGFDIRPQIAGDLHALAGIMDNPAALRALLKAPDGAGRAVVA